MPIVIPAFTKLSSEESICELVEKSSKEEKSEQELEDILDNFIISNGFNISFLKVKLILFLEKKDIIDTFNREVLTPPPERV